MLPHQAWLAWFPPPRCQLTDPACWRLHGPTQNGKAYNVNDPAGKGLAYWRMHGPANQGQQDGDGHKMVEAQQHKIWRSGYRHYVCFKPPSWSRKDITENSRPSSRNRTKFLIQTEPCVSQFYVSQVCLIVLLHACVAACLRDTYLLH